MQWFSRFHNDRSTALGIQTRVKNLREYMQRTAIIISMPAIDIAPV